MHQKKKKAYSLPHLPAILSATYLLAHLPTFSSTLCVSMVVVFGHCLNFNPIQKNSTKLGTPRNKNIVINME
jgi:hypothetical protein